MIRDPENDVGMLAIVAAACTLIAYLNARFALANAVFEVRLLCVRLNQLLLQRVNVLNHTRVIHLKIESCIEFTSLLPNLRAGVHESAAAAAA